MNVKNLELTRQTLQAEKDAIKTQKERNKLGQFATPPALAQEIVNYALRLLPSGEPIRFLDPAFGTGSFYSALLHRVPKADIGAASGFEIDEHYAQASRALWSETGLALHVSDFTQTYPPTSSRERFNLLICNPPYVRHHHLRSEEKIRLQNLALVATGIKINGLAGLYCYFLLLAHAWLSEDGIAVWLIPSEFMDVNYGGPVKRYLLDNVTLLHVHRFDPSDVQFDDALVSSAVVIFRKQKPLADHKVEFSFGGTLAKPKLSRNIGSRELRVEPKWSRFPAAPARSGKVTNTLSDFFSIKRGLATGDNTFFILSEENAKRLEIPQEFLRPILPSPRYLKTNEILADDNGVPLIERRLFLIDCRLQEDEVRERYPAFAAYLSRGVPEVASRYLCKSRKPWYSQENRPPPSLLCTYMGRGASTRPFRFILNHSQATAANVYLLLYPKPFLSAKFNKDDGLLRAIWQELNEVPAEVMLGEGRVYGGGLHKLEPRELANLPVEAVPTLLRFAGTLPRLQPSLI